MTHSCPLLPWLSADQPGRPLSPRQGRSLLGSNPSVVSHLTQTKGRRSGLSGPRTGILLPRQPRFPSLSPFFTPLRPHCSPPCSTDAAGLCLNGRAPFRDHPGDTCMSSPAPAPFLLHFSSWHFSPSDVSYKLFSCLHPTPFSYLSPPHPLTEALRKGVCLDLC